MEFYFSMHCFDHTAKLSSPLISVLHGNAALCSNDKHGSHNQLISAPITSHHRQFYKILHLAQSEYFTFVPGTKYFLSYGRNSY